MKFTVTVPVNGTERTFNIKQPDWPTLKSAFRHITASNDKLSAGEVLVANCIDQDELAMLETDSMAKFTVCIDLYNQINVAIPEPVASTTKDSTKP